MISFASEKTGRRTSTIFSIWFLVFCIALLATYYLLPSTPVLAQTPSSDVGHSSQSVPLDFSLSSFLPLFTRPRADHSLGPILTARSAFVYDLDTREILYTKDITQRLSVASLTKLMTMTVAVESGVGLNKEVLVPLEATKLDPAKLYLLARDALSVRELIFAGLISSANDAAFTLSTILPDFVPAMNRKAMELRLLDTRFANPTGLDDPNNFSTAVDVARLFTYALTHPLIAEATRTRRTTVTSALGKSYDLDSTNILLGDDSLEIIAGKTGTTDDAGQCLINIARLPNGHRILTVVLGSKARFTETKALLRWVENGG